MPAALLGLALAAIPSGRAQAGTTGSLTGTVTDQATGKPLPGVSVVASGPQGDQTEFTDASGHYLLTELPPGDYTVRFWFGDVHVDRPGVLVQADKTLSVYAAVPTGKVKEVRVVVHERAPTVDVATTQVQTEITDELVRNTPVGRDYASVLQLAPGSAPGDAVANVGTSFNGASGPENQYLINGLNTTNPALGLVGTPLPIEFIKETEIITGGYNAEFGRATGGVVNVVTKSGTNQFHGGAWFFYTPPLSLSTNRIARIGEAIARVERPVDQAYDFGVDLGGPIVKNRLFFYAGFAPAFTTGSYDRILRRRTDDNFDPKTMTSGSYAGDLDTSVACPPWLAAQSQALCAPSSAAAYRTEDLDSRLWQHYESVKRRYNGIARLDLRINDDHRLSLTYLGSGTTFDGVDPRRFNGNPDTGAFQYGEPSQTHDLIGHYTGKVLGRALQLDLRVGWHYERSQFIPTADGAADSENVDTRTLPLATFENDLEPCKPQMLGDTTSGSGVAFDPCPVSSYQDGGFGYIESLVEQRATVSAAATYFLKALGTHAIKLGGDFEYNDYWHHREYSGGGAFTTIDTGSGSYVVERQQFASLDGDGTTVDLHDGQDGRPLGFTASTSTLDESLYLRDSWNLGFLPQLTVNLGLRWEAQQVQDAAGATQIAINDNIAPRVGFAWDVFGQGRSKLYASYGRYYESIPLDLNDRQFSGEGFATQDLPSGEPSSCKTDQNGRVDLSTCQFPQPTRADLNGGTLGLVSPRLQGQYSNEVVVGFQYDVGWDLVLEAAYIHRDLGRIIEDISPDGGRTYLIANPGEPADSGTVERLQGEIGALDSQIRAAPDAATAASLERRKADTVNQLALYQAAAGFTPPKRDYNALVLTATKRLSHNFIVQASYTYSRTLGNYPGLYQSSNGQLDPNISSQYDLPELLINRDGPLPTDRPHNFKLTGAYRQPLGAKGGVLTLGVDFYVLSGTPIEVLGRHPTYGPDETFILPRGSGGRTPTLTQLDLRLAYAKTLAKGYTLEASLDVFNVANQQQVTAVDEEYTSSPVLPIENGTFADLKTLKTTTGGAPQLNPNFGQPIAYQAPLSLRAGLRLSF